MRGLRRDWLFSGIAIAILAIGIGANSAVFTLVNTVLFKPLPYREPAGIVNLREGLPDLVPNFYPFSAPDVGQLRQRSKAFSEVASFSSKQFDVSGSIEPRRLEGLRVEAEVWKLMGVAPLLGRLFDVAEDRRGERVAVLSHSTWKNIFGGDPAVIGRNVDLDRKPYIITAVMPAGFVFPPPGMESGGKHTELWVPMSFTKEELANAGDNFGYKVLARRIPGISDDLLRQDLQRVGMEIRSTYPAGFPGKTLSIKFTPMLEEVVGDTRGLFWLLMASVGCVLLIGCANISSLLLVKTLGRRDEFAIRKALGASTWDLMRASFIEGLWLAAPGAVFGLFLASWGVDILIRLAPDALPRLGEVALDWRVVASTALLSVVMALLFSLIPAWQAGQTDPGSVRSGDKGGTQSKASLRLGGGLVALEVALCLVLLGATGLLMQTYWNLLHTNPGFRPERLLAFHIAPAEADYGNLQGRLAFFKRLDPQLAAIPGVKGVSFAAAAPFGSNWQRIFLLEGQKEISAKAPQITHHNLISPGHIENLGVRLLSGRTFDWRDREGQPLVGMINETLARKFFPKGDAIGKRLKFGGPNNKDPERTIVGVVADVKANELSEEPSLQTYEPILQQPFAERQYFLRTEIPPEQIAESVRTIVRGLDRNQVVAEMRTMEAVIDQKAAGRKFQMLLISVFGGAALLLAVTGIFGVISNLVTRQTREIGIRMALGAGPGETLAMVLRRGLLPFAFGLGLGLIGFLAIRKSLESFLYGVQSNDWRTILAAVALMSLAALLAIALPARRAVSVNPAIALRGE